MPGLLHPNARAILLSGQRLQSSYFVASPSSPLAVWFPCTNSLCSSPHKPQPSLKDATNIGIILSVSPGKPARDCVPAETSLTPPHPWARSGRPLVFLFLLVIFVTLASFELFLGDCSFVANVKLHHFEIFITFLFIYLGDAWIRGQRQLSRLNCLLPCESVLFTFLAVMKRKQWWNESNL